MMSNTISIPLTNYEYSILKDNYLISACCSRQLNTVTINKSGVELLLTPKELEDLIGYVAAEANHARTKRSQKELNSICDYLECFDRI